MDEIRRFFLCGGVVGVLVSLGGVLDLVPGLVSVAFGGKLF
ncbi:MAG: hypothetical protein Q8911_03595 [Bacillota bacterium]|nr:hypothetical protein [Bacillota bacterium]